MIEKTISKVLIDCNVIDAPESDYLFVEESQIPMSGKGLFTAIDIYKDEIIAIYKGEMLTENQAKQRASDNLDQYFINLLNGRILDSKNIDCFAKYANDANGSEIKKYRNNAKISLDENENVCLIASKKIKAGEEIFCSYGKKYWEKHN